MSDIGKLAATGVQVISQVVQKTGVVPEKVIDSTSLEKLDGLNALASQKIPFVQSALNAISIEEQKLINLTKDKFGSRFDVFPSDDVICFIVRIQ